MVILNCNYTCHQISFCRQHYIQELDPQAGYQGGMARMNHKVSPIFHLCSHRNFSSIYMRQKYINTPIPKKLTELIDGVVKKTKKLTT